MVASATLERRPRAAPTGWASLIVRCFVPMIGGSLVNCAGHPFDLAVGPRMARLGEAVLEVEVGAHHFKGMAGEG